MRSYFITDLLGTVWKNYGKILLSILTDVVGKEREKSIERFLDKTESKTTRSLCRQMYGMVHFTRVCTVLLAAKVLSVFRL